MEYLLRFDGKTNRFVSDPPGFEMWFEAQTMRFVTNDGREMFFDAARNGFYIAPDGKLVQFNGAEMMFVSEDRTITAWFDGARNAWVVNEGNDPRFRVSVQTIGSGTVTGAGFYEAGASVTVTATPSDGWKLQALQIGGADISNPYTFVMPSNNVVVYAVFAEIETESFLLTERGDFLLLENGGRIII